MADHDVTLLRPSFFRTLFFVTIAGVSLVLIDSVLANTERRETALAAARLYGEGQRLMQQGKYDAAADAFRSAIANARDNPEYPLALGQALLDAGQLDEASSTLTDLLNGNSMAGAPNLAMARVYAKEDQFDEAAFYFHRAIYGQWKQDAAANRVKVRFELADLLAARNSKAELLAELLPLQDLAPRDPATQVRLAQLFLTAASPSRAAAIFRDLAQTDSRDPAVHQGLGEAEMQSGDYAAAQSAFNAVLRLQPENQNAKKSLELCDQVLSLDPLRRGLNAQERYQRSVQVLQLVTGNADRCLSAAQAATLADLMDTAHSAVDRSVPAPNQGEAAETALDLAVRLWQAEKTDCASATPADDDPLQLVLAKASRQADPVR
jgi:predicted Zn-dependent protease